MHGYARVHAGGGGGGREKKTSQLLTKNKKDETKKSQKELLTLIKKIKNIKKKKKRLTVHMGTPLPMGGSLSLHSSQPPSASGPGLLHTDLLLWGRGNGGRNKLLC